MKEILEWHNFDDKSSSTLVVYRVRMLSMMKNEERHLTYKHKGTVNV